ncbi:MAG: diacylglycerol kinase family lipid kinase [Deltaproteobacteria bacterium]|nr:diacylglycerol kinase family lipid kinase [Deltaproteobacteria bacterium]
MAVRPCAILNPAAGHAGDVAVLRRHLEDRAFEVRLTLGDDDATALAHERALAGAPLIVAGGGDGTVSAVARGLIGVRKPVRLAILPLGTGNDLARSLSVPLDVPGALAAIEADRERVIDVIAVEPDDGPRTFAINMAAGGFSGQVDEVLSAELKARWGPLAYVWSAAKVLPDLTGYETTLAFDDGVAARVAALNVIVANARTCGGGWCVAPCADLEDGLLDVFIVRWARALDLARVALHLARGHYTEDEEVLHRRARAVRVETRPPMWFNVDGELVSKAAVTFRVVPRALRVIVGPGY